MSRRPCITTPFDSQHALWSQTPLESAREHFYHIFSLLWWKLSWKISLLVICEIIGLFVNTMSVDDKYFICNSENLPQTIQMQLCKMQKKILKFFLHF